MSESKPVPTSFPALIRTLNEIRTWRACYMLEDYVQEVERRTLEARPTEQVKALLLGEHRKKKLDILRKLGFHLVCPYDHTENYRFRFDDGFFITIPGLDLQNPVINHDWLMKELIPHRSLSLQQADSLLRSADPL